MSLVSDTLLDHIDLMSHPTLKAHTCLNRLQRRYPCTVCADLCPHRVFPVHSGEEIRWKQCTDCGLCVSACPARALSPSRRAFQMYVDTLKENFPLRLTCQREETHGEVHVPCLAALPWELLAILALQGRIILCMRECESCLLEGQRRLLLENVDRLKAFLGEARFEKQVKRIQAGEEIPEADDSLAPETAMNRRELFAAAFQRLERQALKQAEKRLPFLAEQEEDVLWLRRLLAKTVREDKEETHAYGLAIPSFLTSCFGCSICERICPHGALSIVPEEGGTRLIFLEPWKCTGCSLCAKLCPHGGIGGLSLTVLPHLDKLALVRVKSLSCMECGAVLLPGTNPPLCRRCQGRRKTGKR